MATDSSCLETGYNIHDTLFMPQRFPLARTQQSPNSPNLCLLVSRLVSSRLVSSRLVSSRLVSSCLCDSHDTKRSLSALRSPFTLIRSLPRTHLKWTITSSFSPFHTVLSFRHNSLHFCSINWTIFHEFDSWHIGEKYCREFPRWPDFRSSIWRTHSRLIFYFSSEGKEIHVTSSRWWRLQIFLQIFECFVNIFLFNLRQLLCQNLKKAKIKSTLFDNMSKRNVSL